MILYAHAKINWTLNITGRREDGYHLLSSVMQRLSLFDRITLEPGNTLSLRSSGKVPVPEGMDNLALRAASILRDHARISSGAVIRLEKHIPSGAGLGGGSADAAAVLDGLNRFWNCGLEKRDLEALALQLGADVPYCLHDGPMLVSGIGETLSPLPPMPSLPLVLLKGETGLSTQEVYRAFDLLPPSRPADNDQAVRVIREKAFGAENNPHIVNMLQSPAAHLLPEIERLIALLYDTRAVFAEMTGSGSSVFGVYADHAAAAEAAKILAPRCATCILTQTLQPGG